MKSYTDLEQSKKLAKILPIESADMRYSTLGDMHPWVWTDTFIEKDAIPCWSLTALISVLPIHLIVNDQRYVFGMHKGLDKNGDLYMFRYSIFNIDISLYATDYYSNPIDACYEMILKLNELNML